MSRTAQPTANPSSAPSAASSPALAETSFAAAHVAVLKKPEIDRDALTKLLHEIAKLPPVDPQKTLPLQLGRELQYYVPAEIVRRRLTLDDHPSKVLRQHYFPAEVRPYLKALVEGLLGARLPNDFRITQARMRAVNNNGTSFALLELKGQKTEYLGMPLERAETPRIKIKDAELIDVLKSLAQQGASRKQRWEIDGWVKMPDGSKHALTLQLDRIRAVGLSAGSTNPDLVTRPVYLADVELTRSQVRPFMEGQHSFGLLKKGRAVLISAEPKDVQDALGARALARAGLTDEHREVLNALNKRVRDRKKDDKQDESAEK